MKNTPVKEEKKEAVRPAVIPRSDEELGMVTGGGDCQPRKCFTCVYDYGSKECESCLAYRG